MMTITKASGQDSNLDESQANIKISPQQQNVISVCGVMVFVLPEKREEVEARMYEIPGLEIHGGSDEGKLVITIETDSYKKTGDAVSRLQSVEGILSISMIYQHAEALDDDNRDEETNRPSSTNKQLINKTEHKLESH